MLRIADYSSSNPKEYGVYFYDRHIIKVIDEVNSGVKSYLFKLVIQSKNSESIKYKNIEPITFIKTLDLKDLPRRTITFRKELAERFGVDSKEEIDWETYLQTSHKELYDYHIERANRKLAGFIPTPTLIEDEYLEKIVEFLEFTEETANYWAGAYKEEGKKGCYAAINSLINDIDELEYPFNIKPITESWDPYDLPYSFQVEHLDNQYKKSHSENYNDFPLHIQLLLAKKYISNLNVEEYLPYKVYLYGTDDTSYTKYFCTLEEAEQEMNSLRMMQPLDFKLDILDRGYLFTN